MRFCSFLQLTSSACHFRTTCFNPPGDSRRRIDSAPAAADTLRVMNTLTARVNRMTPSEKQDQLLRAKLNLETSQMPWKELERYFAAGMVVAVSAELDLVDVAVRIANDDITSIKQWMSENRISRVSDVQAAAWTEADLSLWTVVVKPWILVQPNKPS